MKYNHVNIQSHNTDIQFINIGINLIVIIYRRTTSKTITDKRIPSDRYVFVSKHLASDFTSGNLTNSP